MVAQIDLVWLVWVVALVEGARLVVHRSRNTISSILPHSHPRLQGKTDLERKRVKCRPHQSNRNRIVPLAPALAGEEGTLRIALKCRAARSPHNLRNGSPRGKQGTRRPERGGPAPAFLMPIADATSRRTLAGRPVTANRPGRGGEQEEGGLKSTPNFSYAHR